MQREMLSEEDAYYGKPGNTHYAFCWINGKIELATAIGGTSYSNVQAISSNGTAIVFTFPTVKHGGPTKTLKWNVGANTFSPLETKGVPKFQGPNDINNSGDIVGAPKSYESILYVPKKPVTILTPPNLATDQIPDLPVVNDAGTVAATYMASDGHTYMFTYANGTYTVPDVGVSNFYQSVGIASNGMVVGTFSDGGTQIDAFTFLDDTLTALSFPGASDGTYGVAGNNAGQVVGYYFSGSTHGFLYQNGKYYDITVPGASSVVGLAINDNGTIAGNYNVPNSKQTLGFVATCATGPGTCTP